MVDKLLHVKEKHGENNICAPVSVLYMHLKN
jgi:hypothetical protein